MTFYSRLSSFVFLLLAILNSIIIYNKYNVFYSFHKIVQGNRVYSEYTIPNEFHWALAVLFGMLFLFGIGLHESKELGLKIEISSKHDDVQIKKP